ncbi:hypothetical protein [Streptomyces flavofungini]|uniref:Transposase n=1 Tax=Streptomyces flavofungini TaxID=68200 RepID=A0ABS0XGB3_9ACTN|nr:hypothetical protein [Streptomyces flavofungini]MBJ3812268.1 hypothetical protein [Streptomyces flavofungini]GHC71061.1 hypothetical protein GCM10010349_47360 [Streptomyces flavofungini]
MNPTTSDPDERATRIYADYLGHLESCPSCRTTDYCPVGDRTRRVWKAAQAAATRAHRAPGDGTRPRRPS